MILLLVDISTNVLRIQFLLDISPVLKQELHIHLILPLSIFKFAEIRLIHSITVLTGHYAPPPLFADWIWLQLSMGVISLVYTSPN